MKLKFDVENKTQPDPFIFEDGGKFYLYVTAFQGVEVYMANSPFDEWEYMGIAATFEKGTNYWGTICYKI